MNHHRNDFCGDAMKFTYFIVNRYAKDLLEIGIGKPPACHRKKKQKVKVIAKKRSIETAPAFDSNCFVLKDPCFYDSSSESDDELNATSSPKKKTNITSSSSSSSSSNCKPDHVRKG